MNKNIPLDQIQDSEVSETDIDAGIGYIVIAGGTKPFEQIKNKKCKYAVSFFKDQAYVKIKCEVDEKFLKEFR